jgi:hypothetical protein
MNTVTRQKKKSGMYISFNAPRVETTLNIVGDKGILCANLSNNILMKKQYGGSILCKWHWITLKL